MMAMIGDWTRPRRSVVSMGHESLSVYIFLLSVKKAFC